MLRIKGWPKGYKTQAYTATVRRGERLEVCADLPLGIDKDGNKTCRLEVTCPAGTLFYISLVDPLAGQMQGTVASLHLAEAEDELREARAVIQALEDELLNEREKSRHFEIAASRYAEGLNVIGATAADILYPVPGPEAAADDAAENCGCWEAGLTCGCKTYDETAEMSMDDFMALKKALEGQQRNGVCAYPNCDCRPEQWCPSPQTANFNRY